MTNTMRRHRYRVVSPIRFFIFVLISIFMITFAGYSLLNVSRADAEAVESYSTVSVQESDTLWEIASMYNPDAKDIQSIVYKMYEINDLDTAELHPGQKILVPVY